MLTSQAFQNKLPTNMSLAERVKKIINGKSESAILEPSNALSKILSGSRIQKVLGGLRDQTTLELSNEVIEGGKKMVITANWPLVGGVRKKQFIVSVTEESISFIGNATSNNYKRLEGGEMQDGKKIEQSLLEAFKDPSIL